MNSPLVSAVMVVCNVDRYLAESIESTLQQTFRDFEFIIVDFGSTDKSKAIISRYAANDNRINFYSIPNCSLTEARNTGCSLAQGRYIAIVDADDVSLPDRFARQVAFMEDHLQVGVLGGATEWIDASGRSLRVDFVPIGDREIRMALNVRCPFWQPTVLIRKQAFALVGGYRTVFAQAEDYDLWLRIAEHFQCANLNEVLVKYRIHPYQISMRRRNEQTLCVLGAQAAAASRKKGLPDPLNGAKGISAEALADWGVPHSNQRSLFMSDYERWIHHMCMAGEYSAALNAALDLLRSDLSDIARRQRADLHLTVARLWWREGKVVSSAVSVGRALLTRPLVAGRPLKALVRGLSRT